MRIALSFLMIFLMFVIGCTKSDVNPPAAKEQKAAEKTGKQAQKGDEAQEQQDVLNSLVDRVK